MKFNDVLKKIRNENNLTQSDLAKKLGYTRTTISAWETGRNEPSYSDLVKISDIFEISLDFLLGITDVKEKSLDTVKFAFANVGTEGLQDEDIEDINRYIEMRKQLAKERKEKK